MFLENKYRRWYFSISGNLKSRVINKNEKYEGHHVIPRSMGGSDNSVNIIQVTYKEHILLHWLLTKCTEGKDYRNMQAAFVFMGGGGKNGRTPPVWLLALARKAGHEANKGKVRSAEVRKRLSDYNKAHPSLPMLGKTHTPEAKAKIAAARTGFKESEKRKEQKRQFMLGNKHLEGHRHTEQTRDKMRTSHMARPYKDRAVWLGKKLSEEHKRKISEAGVRRHAERRLKGSKKQIPSNGDPNKDSPT